MALAEPRRREKWGANVRGMSWSNDQDKLGLKMMQKLGYESGKVCLFLLFGPEACTTDMLLFLNC